MDMKTFSLGQGRRLAALRKGVSGGIRPVAPSVSLSRAVLFVSKYKVVSCFVPSQVAGAPLGAFDPAFV